MEDKLKVDEENLTVLEQPVKINKNKSKRFRHFVHGTEVAATIGSFFAHSTLARYGLFRGQDELVYHIGKQFGDGAFRVASRITNSMIASPQIFALGVGTMFVSANLIYYLAKGGLKLVKKGLDNRASKKLEKGTSK